VQSPLPFFLDDPNDTSQACTPPRSSLFCPRNNATEPGAIEQIHAEHFLQFAWTCFCQIPKPSLVAVLHAPVLQTFPVTHLQGYRDSSELAALFHTSSHALVAHRNTRSPAKHPSSTPSSPSSLVRLSFARPPTNHNAASCPI
jgi:hypothetical protein